jgi:hypothetical protein
MPVGEYEKNNFLIRGLQRKKFPNTDFDEFGLSTKVLKKFVPMFTSTGIPYDPNIPKPTPEDTQNHKESQFGNVVRDLRTANSIAGMGTSAPEVAIMGYNTLRGMGELSNATRTYNALSKIAPAAEGLGKVSTGLNVIGGALSAANLGNDIYNAVKDKHVSFDNAMKISDDATGVASAAVSMIPGVGVPLSIALTGGEKLVTGFIKGAKAVKEEKKREGVKHLDPKTWIDTMWTAATPEWMNRDIGDAYREWKKNKPARKAAKKAEKARKKEEWKHMSGKEKAHRFFFG